MRGYTFSFDSTGAQNEVAMQLIVHHVKDQLKKVRGQGQRFTYGLCKLKFLIVFEACQEMSSCSIFILLPCPAPFMFPYLVPPYHVPLSCSPIMFPYHVPPISVASTSGEDGVCSDKCGRLIVHGVWCLFGCRSKLLTDQPNGDKLPDSVHILPSAGKSQVKGMHTVIRCVAVFPPPSSPSSFIPSLLSLSQEQGNKT